MNKVQIVNQSSIKVQIGKHIGKLMITTDESDIKGSW
jgi:hypothetical protein